LLSVLLYFCGFWLLYWYLQCFSLFFWPFCCLFSFIFAASDYSIGIFMPFSYLMVWFIMIEQKITYFFITDTRPCLKVMVVLSTMYQLNHRGNVIVQRTGNTRTNPPVFRFCKSLQNLSLSVPISLYWRSFVITEADCAGRCTSSYHSIAATVTIHR
jgi:hypothetical protein